MTATRTRVTGLVPPIATPFRDGRLDLGAAQALVDELVPHVHGVLVGGSVGETASLTVEERIELIGAVSACLPPQTFLAVSIADNALPNTERLAGAASAAGAHILVLSCPNYYTNSLEMLVEYFGSVAEFSEVDLCLYDNPVASHTQLQVSDIFALVDAVPAITHVKVTDLTLGKVEALRQNPALTLLAGDDAVLWHQLVSGAAGAMVAMPMIYPAETHQLWQCISSAERQAASSLYARMARFTHLALGAPDYPVVIKAVLHHRGVIPSPEVRPPLIPLSPRRLAEVIGSL